MKPSSYMKEDCLTIISSSRSVRTVTMDKKTFAWCNVYAWGVPLLVCAVGYAMDSLQPGNNSPNFQKDICWFNGKYHDFFSSSQRIQFRSIQFSSHLPSTNYHVV